MGVAHKSLPCGTKVTIRYRGRQVRVPVVDRGPYVGGARVRPGRRACAPPCASTASGPSRSPTDPAAARRPRGVASGAMAGPIAHLDLDAFYATRRAAAPAGAARAARDRRRVGPAGRRHHRVLRGAALRRRLGDARRAGAPAVPGGGRHPAGLRGLPATSRAVMDLVRAHVERVEQVGLDEAYLDLTGLVAPKAAMRAPRRRDPRADGHERVGRHRAEQARGQGRLRRREAGGLRRAHPRGGVRALRAGRRRAGPRDRAADGRAARGARASTTLGALAGGRRGDARRGASAPARARGCARRARFEGSDAVEPVARGGERVARDDVRHRHRRPGAARGDPAST